ncbi:MAG: hypothetical protein KDD47_09120 [Acidobacteria bacterium]|nr:hypothetical protein [Acidobacteriota bacterium]
MARASVLGLSMSAALWAQAAVAAPVEMTIHRQEVVRAIPPGAVGWGAMWKQDILYPAPGELITDADHRAYIDRLGREGLRLARAADLRNISWPWGVTFSTWGVNWENSTGPWSERPVDCARIVLLNKGSGWCEKTVVGVGDLMALAKRWRLEALTVAVPLAVLDGTRVRWGPNFITHEIDGPTIEKISDHGAALIDFMRSRPEWADLQRIYLEAGCEWRHYGQPRAVASYAALIRRIREKIPDEKVIVVASASDSADLDPVKANDWNRALFEQLHAIPGIAADLHRYRGMVGLTAGPGGATELTPENILRLAGTGRTQRGYFTVRPGQWNAGDDHPGMASVSLENAIHGLVGDHSTHTEAPRPWAAVMAHADLVREGLASQAMTFLGWTWFPEDLPAEWPHGAILPNGTLARHAEAQAFLSRYHRGSLLASELSDETAVRGNAVLGPKGGVFLYGGNFSLDRQELQLTGAPTGNATVDLMGETEVETLEWDGRSPLGLPPMTLWRIAWPVRRLQVLALPGKS